MDSYEKFRTTLIMNLCNVLPSEQLTAALQAVDLSMDGYELTPKHIELITADGIPQVVKEFIATKHTENRSLGTLKQYRFRLEHFFSIVQKSYADIVPQDIRMYLHHLEIHHNAAPSYRDTARLIINGFFAWLVENDYLLKNPCAKIKRIHFIPKRRNPLTNFELEELRFETVNIREKAVIDFMFSTGMRVAECAAVRMSDIDWSRRAVIIQHGKGDKPREVYFNAEAEVSLKAYLSSRKPGDPEGLFNSLRAPYNPLTKSGLQEIVKKMSRRTGIKVHAHKFRHTFATYSIRSGMPLHQLQMLMGHAKPETTLIYAKEYQENVRREHERVYA